MLSGIIRSPSTREDEIHNCEVVIGSLAGDVLHTSLTHIAGVDIIDGSREAILNLTEIFVGLLEYMLNKIDSDVSDTGSTWRQDILLFVCFCFELLVCYSKKKSLTEINCVHRFSSNNYLED